MLSVKMQCSVTAVSKSFLSNILVISSSLHIGLGRETKASSVRSVRLHPGIYSFDELVTNDLFVDKTMMVKKFVESKCLITVITRPRKWGKSVNLEMIQRFFEFEVSSIGIQRKISERKNHIIFEGGEMSLHNGTGKVLSPLYIANCSTCMTRLGMSPVIMLRISSIKGKNYEAIEDKLKREIKKMYSVHIYLKEYLKKNLMLNATEKAQLARYYSNKQLTLREVENGLLHLSKLLYEHFRRKVIILIDDYDAALSHAVEDFGERGNETQKVLVLLQNTFKGIIKNVYMEKCLVTGTLPFTEGTLFPNVTKLCVYSVLDEGYGNYFGFSESELDKAIKNVQLSNKTSIDKMKYWYKGYYHSGKTVYNPLDIIGFISNQGKLLDYWVDSGRLKLLDEFLVTDEVQEDLQKLLDDEGTVKTLSTNYNAKSEEGFYSYFTILFRLLVHHGYVNAFNHSESGNDYLLKIPNQEVRNSFVEYNTHWFCTKHNIMLIDLHDFVGCLITRQLDQLKDSLGRIFKSFKNSTLKEEKDYHCIMGVILNRLLNHNLIFSNKHFEIDKLYHIIVPRSKYQGHIGFVLEYKVLSQSNTTGKLSRQLQTLAQGTLDLIDSNVYGPMLVQYKYIDKVVTLAIAFCNTELELAYKVFKQE